MANHEQHKLMLDEMEQTVRKWRDVMGSSHVMPKEEYATIKKKLRNNKRTIQMLTDAADQYVQSQGLAYKYEQDALLLDVKLKKAKTARDKAESDLEIERRAHATTKQAAGQSPNSLSPEDVILRLCNMAYDGVEGRMKHFGVSASPPTTSSVTDDVVVLTAASTVRFIVLGPSGWIPVTDPAAVDALTTLGDLSADKMQWSRRDGRTCTYTIARNDYSTCVQAKTIKQTNTQTRVTREIVAQPSTSPPPLAAPYANWKAQVCYELKTPPMPRHAVVAQLSDMRQRLDTSSMKPSWTRGGANGAAVAALQDLMCQCGTDAFRYDKDQCEIWCKPVALVQFLEIFFSRQATGIAVVAHGVSSHDYDALRDDNIGFNFDYYNSTCAYHQAMYVSLSDHVALDYHALRKMTKYPPGTLVIGLCILGEDDRKAGPYTVAHLAVNHGRWSGSLPARHNNIIAFHEVGRVLMLGLAVPKA